MSQLKKFLFTHRDRVGFVVITIVFGAAAWVLSQVFAWAMGYPVFILGFSAVAVVASGGWRLYRWIKGKCKEDAQ